MLPINIHLFFFFFFFSVCSCNFAQRYFKKGFSFLFFFLVVLTGIHAREVTVDIARLTHALRNRLESSSAAHRLLR